MIYAQKDLKDRFVEFGFELDDNYRKGTTYNDYIDGCWIPLNEKQIEFKDRYPEASVKEVLEMQIAPIPAPTLEKSKRMKLNEIDNYDTSSAVNEFYLQGIPCWLDKATRVGLTNSLTYEQNAGRTESTMWMGETPITLPIASAFKMLEALELYALECYNVTARHKADVRKLKTIEEVKAYDHTTGYPEKINL